MAPAEGLASAKARRWHVLGLAERSVGWRESVWVPARGDDGCGEGPASGLAAGVGEQVGRGVGDVQGSPKSPYPGLLF